MANPDDEATSAVQIEPKRKRQHRRKRASELRTERLMASGIAALVEHTRVVQEDWRESAVCKGEGSIARDKWFPHFPTREPGQIGPPTLDYRLETIALADAAAQDCAICPVRGDCLRFAVAKEEWEEGVYAGLSPFHRRLTAKRAGVRVPLRRNSAASNQTML